MFYAHPMTAIFLQKFVYQKYLFLEMNADDV
jgi:hypothetical protein